MVHLHENVAIYQIKQYSIQTSAIIDIRHQKSDLNEYIKTLTNVFMYNHCHKHNTNMSRNGDNVEMATASSDIKSSVQTKTLEMDKGTLSHGDVM